MEKRESISYSLSIDGNYAIFENMNEGAAVYEAMRDILDEIVDLRIKYINSASIINELMPREEATGKSITEIYNNELITPYLKIANEIVGSNQGKIYEIYFAKLGRYYSLSAFSPDENTLVIISADITEQKKAEGETKRIINGITEAYFELDNEWQFKELNHNAELYIGKKREEIIGKRLTDIFFDAKESGFYGYYHKAKKEYIDVHFEIQSKLTGDWFEVHAYPHPEGLTVYSHAINERKNAEKELKQAHDTLEEQVKKRTIELEKSNKKLKHEIEDRKKAEESLKESEEKFREIFNNANDMIALAGSSRENLPGKRSKYIEVNKVGIERLGYTRDEFLNMTPVDIIAPENRAEMRKNGAELIKNGHAKFEIVHMAKNGKRIPVEVNMHLFKLKGKDVTLSISRDITKRKKAEKELKESEEKFRLLFNNANDMISLHAGGEYDTPGRFIEVNEVGIKKLGYSKEELLNMSPYDIDKETETPKHVAKLIKDGHVQFETVHITKNGRKIPTEINTHIIDYRGTKVSLAISRDISERKKSEKALKETMEELKRSNEELQQFAYVASHDLQEPLRTIASFVQLLEMRYKNKLDEDADEFIDYIVNAAKRMQQMILDLLQYSGVATKGNEFKPTDLERVFDGALFNLKSVVEESRAEVTHDPLPTIMADSGQLIQLFQSLISNAIKFRKEDERPKIHFSVKKDDEREEYVFSVSDNGIGIDSQFFERIFIIFQRLHTNDRYQGTGIGLSISKRIVERHGGHIWVESDLGRGSMFYFALKTFF